MTQDMVGDDAGHHRLADRHGPDADAGIVPAGGAQSDLLAGDLLVTPRIVMPDTIDAEFEAALQRLRDEKSYDPGR